MSTDLRATSDLQTIRDALDHAPQLCRFHGTDYERLGMAYGEPRCESCRQPWRVTRALAAVGRLMAQMDQPRGELADAHAALQQAKDRFDAIEAAYADILHREIEHRGHGRDGHLNEQDLKLFFDALYRSGAASSSGTSTPPEGEDHE